MKAVLRFFDSSLKTKERRLILLLMSLFCAIFFIILFCISVFAINQREILSARADRLLAITRTHKNLIYDFNKADKTVKFSNKSLSYIKNLLKNFHADDIEKSIKISAEKLNFKKITLLTQDYPMGKGGFKSYLLNIDLIANSEADIYRFLLQNQISGILTLNYLSIQFDEASKLFLCKIKLLTTCLALFDDIGANQEADEDVSIVIDYPNLFNLEPVKEPMVLKYMSILSVGGKVLGMINDVWYSVGELITNEEKGLTLKVTDLNEDSVTLSFINQEERGSITINIGESAEIFKNN